MNILNSKILSGKKTFKETIRKTQITFYSIIEKEGVEYIKILFNSINNYTTSTFVKVDNSTEKTPFSRVIKNLQYVADNNNVKYTTIIELIENLRDSRTKFYIKAILNETNEDHISYEVAPWHIQLVKKSLDFVPKKSKSKKV